jgi:hypothetical protein
MSIKLQPMKSFTILTLPIKTETEALDMGCWWLPIREIGALSNGRADSEFDSEEHSVIRIHSKQMENEF